MSALSILPLTVAWFAAQPAAAEVQHPVHGTWTLATPAPALRARLDRTVNAAASEFNLLVRELARRKMQGATKVCGRYAIDIAQTVVRFTCDDGTVHPLPRDGSAYETTNKAGEPVRGTVTVTDEALTVSWRGPAGTRVNHFEPVEGALELRVTVRSEHMSRPLAWTVDYRQAPTSP